MGSFSTLRFASSGSSRSTGSSSLSLPSSTSIITATAVIGFVIEASANIVSRFIGMPASLSWKPRAETYAMVPWR